MSKKNEKKPENPKMNFYSSPWRSNWRDFTGELSWGIAKEIPTMNREGILEKTPEKIGGVFLDGIPGGKPERISGGF